MRRLLCVFALSVFLLPEFAHGAPDSSPPVSPGEAAAPAAASGASIVTPAAPEPAVREAATAPPAGKDGAEGDSEAAEDDFDYDMEDVPAAEQVTIADPWEPFNRAMFTFNDRLYFWVLKPVAEGYSAVVPEPARVSVGNFFSNLRAPIRFVNCVLQANLIGASTELFRFMLNSTIGLAGLFDPAGGEEIGLLRQDEDFGQTLGVYGVGQGFYIVWPFFGPSSPRDTVGMVGDFFSYPISYLDPWYACTAVRGYQAINDTSLQIGDYEAIKDAAIDPYVSIRNAYIQYRQKKVEERGATIPRSEPDVPGAGTPARGVGTEAVPQK
ncbi:MAG TPA: VacJ family lipoprotein [Syntrophales bacterium]|nr:VacJ family lipoprotein [Syntrophales bacterium]